MSEHNSYFCCPEGQPSAKEIGRHMGGEQPAMAATLSRMERDGLITRHQDESDAKVQRVRLTVSARSLRDIAVSSATEVNARALADLSADEKIQIIGLMTRVIASLEAPDP